MKKLILGLMLSAGVISTVQATNVAYTENDAGGRIVLTNQICVDGAGQKFAELRHSYLYTASGFTINGCFYLDTDNNIIRVKWFRKDGSVSESRYPLGIFTLYNKK
jgi:hypothetical protein